MNLTHVTVKIRNHKSEDSFTAVFRVDIGVWNCVAPTKELKRIGIEPFGKMEFELANGQVEEYEYCFAEIEFMDELTATRILFGADDTEPLLGVLALQSAGFIIDRENQTLRKLPALPLKYFGRFTVAG